MRSLSVAKRQAPSVISQILRAFQMLLWMSADVSWHDSWQPLVPEIAPVLGADVLCPKQLSDKSSELLSRKLLTLRVTFISS